MEIKKVSAIFDELRLKDVQEALRAYAASGFSTHCVGASSGNSNANSYLLIKHTQIEIYVDAEHAKKVARLIESSVVSVNDSDKFLVSIEPIEGLFGCSRKLKLN
ncbi:MAG: transcriptional regulator [Oleispira sp.]|nr:transcriptional regulator [Oleispira sp.]|tara:strand:+ start:737 stop:1051 length:315 start_codon:yes stop_codon:yes gene_type:complete